MLLAYDDYGPGPVVVLLHGFPLNRKMWAGQETEIGSVYRVIAPDLRGHGETAAPEGVYTMDDMADDVMETLDALQIREPVVLGGLSMGGYIALSAVLRYPDRFRALMLMDTRAGADAAETARGRLAMANQVDSTGKNDAVIEGMLARLFSPFTRQNRAHLIDFAHGLMVKTPARAVAGALRGMAARPDCTPDLPRIALPTLVLVGEDDLITPPDVARVMAEALPQARLEIIPEAGHLAPLENPAASNRAILEFLSGLT
jgi:pimeloyl-ACP methyl ester carboxylesterase